MYNNIFRAVDLIKKPEFSSSISLRARTCQ